VLMAVVLPWLSAQEDKRLMELVDKYGAQNWTQIAQSLGGRWAHFEVLSSSCCFVCVHCQ
jgi:hypothetical protein